MNFLATAQLPDVAPISGFFWTWVVPPVLFGIALAATFMLYRHFAGKKQD